MHVIITNTIFVTFVLIKKIVSFTSKRDWFIKWIPLRFIYAAIVMILIIPKSGYLFIVLVCLSVLFSSISIV